jgi:hypothetical protein
VDALTKFKKATRKKAARLQTERMDGFGPKVSAVVCLVVGVERPREMRWDHRAKKGGRITA